MVAIVSGNNNGLFSTSAGQLGQYGLGGSALHGNTNEAAYVNVFNGNLALTRTYNSQAVSSDTASNGWRDVLRAHADANSS